MGVDDYERPLAVYEDAVFRWNGAHWTLVRDQLKLPQAVMPPRIAGSTLLVRDEGRGENDKRLWWTDVTSDEPLIAHDQSLGFGWFDALSYQFTRTGEFWFSMGNSASPGWTLVRRLKSGEFRLAIVNGQTRFRASEEATPAVSITAIKELSNGELVGAGDLGFYRIEDDKIITLVRFRDSSQITADSLDWRWDPTDLLELSPRQYLISGLFGGIYLLDLSADEYRLIELDERIGAPTEL